MLQLLNKQKHDVYVEVMSCHMYAFDILFEDGPSQEYSTLKRLTHEHDNHQELMAMSGRYLAKCFMTSYQAIIVSYQEFWWSLILKTWLNRAYIDPAMKRTKL